MVSTRSVLGGPRILQMRKKTDIYSGVKGTTYMKYYTHLQTFNISLCLLPLNPLTFLSWFIKSWFYKKNFCLFKEVMHLRRVVNFTRLMSESLTVSHFTFNIASIMYFSLFQYSSENKNYYTFNYLYLIILNLSEVSSIPSICAVCVVRTRVRLLPTTFYK